MVVQDLLTQYFDDGDHRQPVMLMLHGWGTDAHNFDGLSAYLAKGFRVLRLDLPGFGGTQAPASAWYVRDYAEFVARFLEKLGVAELRTVIGHSFGGRIVIAGLAEGLLIAQTAVLLDSAGIKPPKTLRVQVIGLVARVGKRVLAIPGLSQLAPGLRRRLYQSAGSADYLESGPLRQIFLNTINQDLSADAARIAVPTLIIWGADDLDTPPADGRALANLIPNSTLSLVAGAGHFVHLDAPDRVNLLIKDFLR